MTVGEEAGGGAHPGVVCGGADAEGLRGRGLRDRAVGDARVQQHAHVGGPEEEVEVDGEGDEVHVGEGQLGAQEGEDRGRVVDDRRHLGEHRRQHLLRRQHVLRRAALVQQRLHATATLVRAPAAECMHAVCAKAHPGLCFHAAALAAAVALLPGSADTTHGQPMTSGLAWDT